MSKRFDHPLVRELAWSIGSAPLMTRHHKRLPYDVLNHTWFDDQLSLHHEWLESLDVDPSSLIESFPSGKLLLGKRFEHLIGFWLEHSPSFRILDRNVIFSSASRTLGELDFLIQDVRTGENYHIEVACKFYLSLNESPQWKYWIGPGEKDTLRLKMDKLDKQLGILSTNTGKSYLKEKRIGSIKPALLLKGYFFHHYTKLFSTKDPVGAYAKYPSGWWLRERELTAFMGGQRDTNWITLPKKSWLAPFRGKVSETEVWNDYDAELTLAQVFQEWKRPIMVIKVVCNDGFWEETSRGFLVGNSFGNAAQSS